MRNSKVAGCMERADSLRTGLTSILWSEARESTVSCSASELSSLGRPNLEMLSPLPRRLMGLHSGVFYALYHIAP